MPVGGVSFNLSLVPSARLLTEVYLFITSLRYPQSNSLTVLGHPQPGLRLQIGALAAAQLTADGEHQHGLRFVSMPLKGRDWWTVQRIDEVALVLSVLAYKVAGHRILASGGNKVVFVTPRTRVSERLRADFGLSNGSLAAGDERAKRSIPGGSSFAAWVSELLPELQSPGDLRDLTSGVRAEQLFHALDQKLLRLGSLCGRVCRHSFRRVYARCLYLHR